jgi:hypothetical protein
MTKNDILRLIELYDKWIDMKDTDIFCYEANMKHPYDLYDGEGEIIDEIDKLCELAESIKE